MLTCAFAAMPPLPLCFHSYAASTTVPLRRLSTGLFQPLGPGSPWFVEPGLETIESDSDIFGVGNACPGGAAAGIVGPLGATPRGVPAAPATGWHW